MGNDIRERTGSGNSTSDSQTGRGPDSGHDHVTQLVLLKARWFDAIQQTTTWQKEAAEIEKQIVALSAKEGTQPAV